MIEKEKEAVLFVMSMSDTMKILAPAPIEMDSTDETKTDIEAKSRWAICAELIRLMVKQMNGLSIDLLLGKNSDIGGSITRGNSEDRLSPIFNLLQTLSTQTRSSGMCNPEWALREFDKFMANSEYTTKSIHWFVDAETFVTLDPSFISHRFETLTIYVVGELRTIHNDYKEANEACVAWTEQLGATVRLLVCAADFEELKLEITTENRCEQREKSVPFVMGNDVFEVDLLGTCEFGSPAWECDAIAMVGFLSDIELYRLSVHTQEYRHGDAYNVSSTSEVGNEILWSMANFMLADSKRTLTCLCKCLSGITLLEYGFLVAELDDGGVSLSLLRFRDLPPGRVLELQAISSFDEASEGLPDNMNPQFAPVEHRIIKKRLSDIADTSKEDGSAKRMKFDSFANEYRVLGAEEPFNELTATWQKENLDS